MKISFKKTVTNVSKKIIPSLNKKDAFKDSKIPIIDVINVSKNFTKWAHLTFLKKEKVVLDKINLKIKAGERIAVLGANGAGKTTLVETICGLRQPTSGHIEYNYRYTDVPVEKMGVQFQSFTYLPGLTVMDNIKFIIDAYGIKTNERVISNLLKIFGLSDLVDKKANKLSGGQQQRLNVLLAILPDPLILILDELSTGLDLAIKEKILNFLDEYTKAKKITLLFVSHDIEEILKLANRIVFLKDGKISADETKKSIIQKYGNVKEFLTRELKKHEIEVAADSATEMRKLTDEVITKQLTKEILLKE